MMLLQVIVCVVLAASTAAICTTDKKVEKDVAIPLNSDSGKVDLAITTDSLAGSNDMVNVYFSSEDGDAAAEDVGWVSILFDDMADNKGDFATWWCDKMIFLKTAPLPTKTEKTWRIVYDPDTFQMVVHCNGEEVLSLDLATECSDSDKKDQAAAMKFIADNASDDYCLGGE